MAIRPQCLARLVKGLSLGARRNKYFAETFNWMSSWLGNLVVTDGLALEGDEEGMPELKADVVKDLDVEKAEDETEEDGATYLVVKYSKSGKADKRLKIAGVSEIGNFRFNYSTREIEAGVICVARTFIMVNELTIPDDYTGDVQCRYSFSSATAELQMVEDMFINAPDDDTTYIPLYTFVQGLIEKDYRGAPVIQSYEDYA